METNPFRAQNEDQSDPPLPHDAEPDAPLSAEGWFGVIRTHIVTRVVGRNWWVRAPLLVILLWLLRGYAADPMYSSIFDGINLGFHEAGHAAFSWLGSRILTTAGGTIFQLAIPTVAGIYLFLKQRDPFGAAVCAFWLGTALVGAGVYAADARAQALPLVSPFGPIDVFSHDWTVMLMKYGMLSQDTRIGAFLRRSGLSAMVASTAASVWILWLMARTPRQAE